MPSLNTIISFVGLVATFVAVLYEPVHQRLTTLGFLRKEPIEIIHGASNIRKLADTAMCEDLHHHLPSNLLFSACEDDEQQRLKWFPPLAVFNDHTGLKQASLTVIDPVKLSVRKLKLKGFSGPFVSHGIDLYTSANDPTLVYIFAVNHLPNPDHYDPPTPESRSGEKARSQIEIFKHTIGSNDAHHVRSVLHPLIRTPNDIYATGPFSFYVTNDHYYREGPLRTVEDVGTQLTCGWTDTVYVEASDDPSVEPDVKIAIKGLHNNNGLGHASRSNEILIVDAAGGVISRATEKNDPLASNELKIIEHIQIDFTLDNPSYYEDPYATGFNNASGYIVVGMTQAHKLAEDRDKLDRGIPATVQHIRANNLTTEVHELWEKRTIFQDDGSNVRSASSAVMVPINPKDNNELKQALLFVTGFLSRAMVVTKIDL